METRICKKCGQVLPLEMFEAHRHTCRKCRSKYKSDQRRQKPNQYNKYATDRQNRCSAWINSLKTPCIFCGETDPVCIDWHHVDPSKKEFQISFIRGKSKERTLAEMAKCICICASCHRKLHAGHLSLEQVGITNPAEYLRPIKAWSEARQVEGSHRMFAEKDNVC